MNKEKMKKYESPSTRRTLVELEDGVCTASATVTNPNEQNGRIESHDVNTDFDYEFKDEGWN